MLGVTGNAADVRRAASGGAFPPIGISSDARVELGVRERVSPIDTKRP